jgi:metal-responsive CopG/Arc/MetJ family transcriptional regulator
MPRTIIDIPTPLLREVDRLCKRLNLSRAEAVRRGLKAFVEQNAEVNLQAFALWKDAEPSRDALLARLRTLR